MVAIHEAVQSLERARDAHDLSLMQRIAGEALNALPPEERPSFVVELLHMLSSVDFGNFDRQRGLVHSYAAQTLASGVLPTNEELELLAHLHDDFEEEGQSVSEWQAKRRDRADRWLRALGAVEAAIVEDFDFEDQPLLNVAPPPAATVSAGAAPEMISDPRIRATYEATIAANAAKAQAMLRQRELRSLRDAFEPEGFDYIARAYARAPEDLEELSRLLDSHGFPSPKKEGVLARIREQIARPEA